MAFPTPRQTRSCIAKQHPNQGAFKKTSQNVPAANIRGCSRCRPQGLAEHCVSTTRKFGGHADSKNTCPHACPHLMMKPITSLIFTMNIAELSRLLRHNDINGLHELLHVQREAGDLNLEIRGRRGRTPLMLAAAESGCDAAMMRVLLEAGADPLRTSSTQAGGEETALSLAIKSGQLAKISLLLEFGASLRYRRTGGYDALLDASFGRYTSGLPALLTFLLEHGAPLDGRSDYDETALHNLAREGRFAALRVLLEANADAEPLQWNTLMYAIALGSLPEMAAAVAAGAGLETRDSCERTPWLLAVHSGDTAKADWLRQRGADVTARGRCRKPAVFYAIETGHIAMLQWLLHNGFSAEDSDEFGTTALVHAVEFKILAAVEVLLQAGAAVDWEYEGRTALYHARDHDIAHRLVRAGAATSSLPDSAQRALVGLPAATDQYLITPSAAAFAADRLPRFGTTNPEMRESEFCLSMIVAGSNAYTARSLFPAQTAAPPGPVWSAERFGQSLTLLPDGRIVRIGGEHEDFYDPDFCIYNDVFVHHPDGRIQLFCYPAAVFPPTDFHSATLVGHDIILIGALGYPERRQSGVTPVFALDTRSFAIRPLAVQGIPPGWIYEHHAVRRGHTIEITGGRRVDVRQGEEEHCDNSCRFVLDLEQMAWLPPT